jgi:acyl-CoA thioester hydrolase
MGNWYHEKHIVEFYECDPLSMVHNSKYLIWFERARFQIAEEANIMSIVKECMEAGEEIMFPVLEAECKYILPIPLGSHLNIRTKLEKPKIARLEFKHIVTDAITGQVYAKAKTVIGLLSSKRGLLFHMTEEMKKLINDYLRS